MGFRGQAADHHGDHQGGVVADIQALDRLAALWCLKRDELLDRMSLNSAKTVRRYEEVRSELASGKAYALLLPDNELAKLQRYEAHLQRTFVRDLRELQALQARRGVFSTYLPNQD